MGGERKGEQREGAGGHCSARLRLHSFGCQFTGIFLAQGGGHFSEEAHPSEEKDSPSTRSEGLCFPGNVCE